MRISAPGSDCRAPTRHRCAGRCAPRGLNLLGAARRCVRSAPTGGSRGFTLLELLVVVAIMALATAGVSLALRDSAGTQLEREAQRLAALLESGRAQARMASVVVRWRPTPAGFAFEGLPGAALPDQWLGNDVQVAANASLVLGPEPIIGLQQVRLVSLSNPSRSLVLGTDGIRPFTVLADPPMTASPQ